jgi:hypothetical protein
MQAEKRRELTVFIFLTFVLAPILAVVLESADGRAIAHTASELQQLSGVLTVSIVAHLTERASALEELDEPTSIPAQ